MAVDARKTRTVASASAGRRVLVGTNVFVTVALMVGIAGVLQLFAYKTAARWDMTSSRINSLSDGTESLLGTLDVAVRLTSLYFETDLEEEDQQRYRRGIDDLLGLYASTNRSRVTADWVNPLSDHEKLKKLIQRLRENGKFREGIAAYSGPIDGYRDGPEAIDGRMRELIKSELDRIAALGGGIGPGATQTAATRVEDVLAQWTAQLEDARERVDALMLADNPQYTAAVHELANLYNLFKKSLEGIARFGESEVARTPSMPPAQAEHFRSASARFASTLHALEEETTTLQTLEPLDIEDLLRKLAPNANAIVVETDNDAIVVEFSAVWPPQGPQGQRGRVGFANRAFKGEEKLTSAILRVTHKEQTAVTFVRYGDGPLFSGGYRPGQPPAPFTAMKERLEDVNFIVNEWDLGTSDQPPTIDPTPTRTIYVLLKPAQPPRQMSGQPPSNPPFSETHKRRILDKIGEDGRVLFVAGWYPGPFGPIPATYEYGEYLKDTWGIMVDTSALLIAAANTAPGKYNVMRRDFYGMRDLSVGTHEIVGQGNTGLLYLPWCAPLDLADPPPDGVEHAKLVTQEHRDGLWGIKNIQAYQDQLAERDYLTKAEGDLEGPFDLAVAATKGEAKIVVISARDFAIDQVAFAQEFGMSSEGFSVRSRNPGNVALLINSLHWLNDKTEFMGIGKPIEAVLEIKSATVRTVQVLTIFVWPALALLAGGTVWWIRRR